MKKKVLFLVLTLTYWNLYLDAQSRKLDQQFGAQNALMVEAEMGIYPDEALTEWVAAVGNRLVAKLGDQPFSYRFKIADTEIPNAFALPGGYAYITRGLLALINDENELAGIMAHEIIHAHRRHSVKGLRLTREILPGIIKIPGAIVGLISKDLGDLLIVPVDLIDAPFKAGYGRGLEKEADQYGIRLAVDAGYDPQGLITSLSNLSREVEYFTGRKEKAGILDDHPITPKRIKYLNKEIPKLVIDLQPPESAAPYELLDGLLFGENPANGVFIDTLFLQPELGLRMIFPSGWHTANQPDAVVGIQPDQEATISLTIGTPGQTPKEQAEAFKEKLNADYKKMITREEVVQVNGFDGYLISITDKTEKEPAYIQLLWLRIKDQVYQLSGLGLEKYQSIIEESARTIGLLPNSERKRIKKKIIQVVAVKENESLEQLSERTGNIAQPNFVAILNNIKTEEPLKAGQRLKIIVEKDYE